jgi:hypothetical protein
MDFGLAGASQGSTIGGVSRRSSPLLPVFYNKGPAASMQMSRFSPEIGKCEAPIDDGHSVFSLIMPDRHLAASASPQ